MIVLTTLLLINDLCEPIYYAQAIRQGCWGEAMKEEMEAMKSNQTWSLVPYEPHMNIVGSKWVYKVKKKADGSIERIKGRLVARGFTQ